MPVELRNEQRAVRLDLRRLRRQAESLMAQVRRADSVLSLLLTDDRRMARLHLQWMGEEGPTDVMSFPGEEKGTLPGRPLFSPVLGDIVISVQTAARRRPNDPAAEILRYLVHGLLHLTGHDHRSGPQRLRMNRRARQLQAKVRAA